MTRKDLAKAGKLLHGTRWQAGLAKDLGVSPRLVRFWASGDRPLAGWVPGAVLARLALHATVCEEMKKNLEES